MKDPSKRSLEAGIPRWDKNVNLWTPLAVQWLRLCTSTAEDAGSIPGPRSSTYLVVGQKNKNKVDP